MLICTKLCVFMVPIFLIKSNNLFKQQFLMHLTYVLCRISIIEYSYRSFNYIIFIIGIIRVIILIFTKLYVVMRRKV
jgi:hypothetical protein